MKWITLARIDGGNQEINHAGFEMLRASVVARKPYIPVMHPLPPLAGIR